MQAEDTFPRFHRILWMLNGEISYPLWIIQFIQNRLYPLSNLIQVGVMALLVGHRIEYKWDLLLNPLLLLIQPFMQEETLTVEYKKMKKLVSSLPLDGLFVITP
jgi:hypothetical protein